MGSSPEPVPAYHGQAAAEVRANPWRRPELFMAEEITEPDPRPCPHESAHHGVGAVSQRALAIARECSQCGYQAWALWLLGEISSHGDFAETRDGKRPFPRSDDAGLTKSGCAPRRALHLGLGKVYRHTGKASLCADSAVTPSSSKSSLPTVAAVRVSVCVQLTPL